MEKQFASKEISIKLKELGFDEECLAYYITTQPITLDRDGKLTDFVLLSAKLRGELVGHGSVSNTLFKYLKDHDLSHGELYTLSNSVTAPLWQQVLNWFEKEHQIYISILPYRNKEDEIELCWYYTLVEDSEELYDIYCNANHLNASSDNYDTPELARTNAIQKAIEIVENRLN